MKNRAGYVIVQDDLKRSIGKGDFQPGDKLPSENELASKYGYSRMTIRKAMDYLETDGVICREKGKRSIVGFKQNQVGWISESGLSEIMMGQEKRIDTGFVNKPIIKPWDTNFYWALSDMEKGGDCIFLAHIRYVRNRPVIVEEMYFSDRGLEGFCQVPLINRSIFGTLLVRYNIETMDVVQKFKAIPANRQLARALDLSIGSPVLQVSRKIITSKTGFHVYAFAYCANEVSMEA